MKQNRILRILLVALLPIVLIACNIPKKEDVIILEKTVVPDYYFPELPSIDYYYPLDIETVQDSIEKGTADDEWVVPGSYLRALDAYFELIIDLEEQYKIDKEEYDGRIYQQIK